MDLSSLFRFFQGNATEKEIQQIDSQLSNGGEDAYKEYERAHFLYDGIMLFDGKKISMRQSRLAPVVRILSIAAILVAIAVPTSIYLLKGSSSHPAANLLLETHSGQTASLTLSDGTKVLLNAGSKLEYPSYFDGTQRIVSLTGEAYFDVTHDSDHPFIVSTFASDVTVHGTSFNVVAREAENLFTTTLVEGSVSLTNKKNPSEVIFMKPSDVVSLQDEHLIPQADGFSSLCWIKGKLDLRCKDFDTLMSRLENVYGIKITVNGVRPSTSGLSGEIATSHGADYAMKVLGYALGIKYSIGTDGTYTVTCK